MIMTDAVVLHALLWHLEGLDFSLIAGIYWTIAVMTTLGLVTSPFIALSAISSLQLLLSPGAFFSFGLSMLSRVISCKNNQNYSPIDMFLPSAHKRRI
jgi:hypothetical protein